MNRQQTFQRGITFAHAAPPTAKALAGRAAASFGVVPSWTLDDTRLVIMGPRESVDAFFTVAQAALTLAGRMPAAA